MYEVNEGNEGNPGGFGKSLRLIGVPDRANRRPFTKKDEAHEES